MPKLELYSVRFGKVQAQAGLNWGLADAHVNSEDAYIALTTTFLEKTQIFSRHTVQLLMLNGMMEKRCNVC